MPVMDGYDYDEYQVYITLPKDTNIEDVLKAGMEALGMEPDTTLETNWINSHYN